MTFIFATCFRIKKPSILSICSIAHSVYRPTVYVYELDNRGIGVRFPAGAQDLSLLRSISYRMGKSKGKAIPVTGREGP
jgi:hypothetical protein